MVRSREEECEHRVPVICRRDSMRLRIVIIAAEFGRGRGTERRSEAPLSGLVATVSRSWLEHPEHLFKDGSHLCAESDSTLRRIVIASGVAGATVTRRSTPHSFCRSPELLLLRVDVAAIEGVPEVAHEADPSGRVGHERVDRVVVKALQEFERFTLKQRTRSSIPSGAGRGTRAAGADVGSGLGRKARLSG